MYSLKLRLLCSLMVHIPPFCCGFLDKKTAVQLNIMFRSLMLFDCKKNCVDIYHEGESILVLLEVGKKR